MGGKTGSVHAMLPADLGVMEWRGRHPRPRVARSMSNGLGRNPASPEGRKRGTRRMRERQDDTRAGRGGVRTGSRRSIGVGPPVRGQCHGPDQRRKRGQDRNLRSGPLTFKCESAVTTGSSAHRGKRKYKGLREKQNSAKRRSKSARNRPLPTKFVRPIEYAFNANGLSRNWHRRRRRVRRNRRSRPKSRSAASSASSTGPPRQMPLKLKKGPKANTRRPSTQNEEVATTTHESCSLQASRSSWSSRVNSRKCNTRCEGQCEEFPKTKAKTGKYNGHSKKELARGT